MNSKGHLIISLAKSIIRVVGGIATLITSSIIPLAAGIIIAEIGGVLEELVDKRQDSYFIQRTNEEIIYGNEVYD